MLMRAETTEVSFKKKRTSYKLCRCVSREYLAALAKSSITKLLLKAAKVVFEDASHARVSISQIVSLVVCGTGRDFARRRVSPESSGHYSHREGCQWKHGVYRQREARETVRATTLG